MHRTIAFVSYFLVYAIVFGLLIGLFYLISKDWEYATSHWELHVGSIVLVSAIGAFIHWDDTDTLWDALMQDYPGVSLSNKSLASSKGPLVSTHFERKSSATSYVSEAGIHLQRRGSRKNRKQWITIPWAKISRIVVAEPVEGYSIARLDLIRDTNRLALAIPWNRAFDKSVPPSINFDPNWRQSK